MLLPSRNGQRGALRHALQLARETYRRHGGLRRAAPVPALRDPAREQGRQPLVRDADPDVLLDVPHLEVETIDLELDQLEARVALEAHVLDLLRLDVGVNASLGRVNLRIRGVDAQAHLKVRLDNLAVMVDRVLETVDRNPQILESLARGVGQTAGDIGRGAQQAVDEATRAAARATRR